jgi:hypothetical protein
VCCDRVSYRLVYRHATLVEVELIRQAWRERPTEAAQGRAGHAVAPHVGLSRESIDVVRGVTDKKLGFASRPTRRCVLQSAGKLKERLSRSDILARLCLDNPKMLERLLVIAGVDERPRRVKVRCHVRSVSRVCRSRSGVYPRHP